MFARITPLLTDEVVLGLNGRVDVHGEDPADVACEWVKGEGLVD